MTACKGKIVSFEHGSASDGEGLRSVLFLHGCNLVCPFCHNPETLYGEGREITSDEVTARLKRYLPFLRGGGITLSGGEPFLQRDFCLAVTEGAHALGLTAIAETNGLIADEALIAALDGIRLDIKNQSGESGERLISRYSPFLSLAKDAGKDVLLTSVLVPGVNDDRASLAALAALKAAFPFARGVKLLPFRKLCMEKYARLGRPFPYADKQEPTPSALALASRLINGEE